jgi:hypothetical protein
MTNDILEEEVADIFHALLLSPKTKYWLFPLPKGQQTEEVTVHKAHKPPFP